ncbi:muscle-specific protein 300 kDa-like isoform X2 [Daktulosphaira vitifoliae]|uniref:muscle-specific protein 300 kDa-like isoform X2 n=1 Tax=Daktulosphaira vitifoliae TaxID=58002 RepID=UPI0021AAFA98|nr:muscle-specific protein 300 kDa-like isoform X2 [Daktulosphaira vitifoliae]
MQSTIKDILNNCKDSIIVHQNYIDKYNECFIQLSNTKEQFAMACQPISLSQNIQQYLVKKYGALNDLLNSKSNITFLLNSCVELSDKLYLNTCPSGKEAIKSQLDKLQNSIDTLFDDIMSLNREVKNELNKWSEFEEMNSELKQWFSEIKRIINKNMELKSTLDEKKMQLQIYRDILQTTLKRETDVKKLVNNIKQLQIHDNSDTFLDSISNQYDEILNKIQEFVNKYEAIVKDHEQYTTSVMEMQEWLDATHNTLLLWSDTNLEKISLLGNLDRIKNLLVSLTGEENKIHAIKKLAEKVIPGTSEQGQVNIRSQIDSSQQDWEGLISYVKTSIEALEEKLNNWNEFDTLKDLFLTWLRDADYKIHAIDLKTSLQEKKNQLDELKDLQGILRTKEFEIDAITEKSQNLYTLCMSNKNSQISEIVQKYHNLSMKIKELIEKWQQYVDIHLEFESNLNEAIIWLENTDDKLTTCGDFKSTNKSDLEEKLINIQEVLLYKENGFNMIQNCTKKGQIVLASTTPDGHKAINDSLISLQEHWSALASKMLETKANIDESIKKWSDFSENVKQVGKTIDKFEETLSELTKFETSLSEKRSQLEKIKNLDEKIKSESIEMELLKSKAEEILKNGYQSSTIFDTRELFKKFDNISDKIKTLLSEREQQFKDHKSYKEAFDELSNFLNRSKEKIPILNERPLNDKLAIEQSITPLDSLLNKKAQGELLLDNLVTIGNVIKTNTSDSGNVIISEEISMISDELTRFFDDVTAQKETLQAIHSHWREYKDEYEKLSDWLQQNDITMKSLKNTLLATLDEKKNQVKQIEDVLDDLKNGKSNINKFNNDSTLLLTSHLGPYISNQLRQLNSRYEIQVNLANDVKKKIESNLEHHMKYEELLEKAKSWINNAKEGIRHRNESVNNLSKEILQARLNKILEILKTQEEGQLIIHSTINCGEKALRSTRSDGKDIINNQLKEIQSDWERLIKKISNSKVHIETSLLQWADYNSSYSHLQQWISDREAKLENVLNVKKSQVGVGTLSIGERKAALRKTNSIMQDIVSFEPMIHKVTLKAEDLQQAVPANEITNKYQTLSIKAKDLYEKQKEAVRLHQDFIDAGNDFATWLRNAKEKARKISDPTGDKETLNKKSVQLKVLISELTEGQTKLEIALEKAEKACLNADGDEKEIIEQEVAMLQEEYDVYTESLQNTKSLLEDGICKLNEFDDYSNTAIEWLNKTEKLVQSYNKLQPSLEKKKQALEEFQNHLQTLFDWQSELDNLNGKAQILLGTCSDTRLSNSITQMTTKYDTLISLAKEVMRQLEQHYQEHQQQNSLYQESLDWIERIRDKVWNYWIYSYCWTLFLCKVRLFVRWFRPILFLFFQ